MCIRDRYDTTACSIDCCSSFPKEPGSKYYFHSVQTNWRYIDSGRPEPKLICSTSPGEDLPTDASPRTRSVLRGPSPRRGNASGFRRTFEAQGLGAHVARRARTAAPRPRSTPPMSTRRFVSRRHKSRGYPRCHTGLKCGQFIVLEASQRPVINVFICIFSISCRVDLPSTLTRLVFSRGFLGGSVRYSRPDLGELCTCPDKNKQK